MNFASFVAPMRAELYRLTRSRAGRAGLLAPALLATLQIFGSLFFAQLDTARRAAHGMKVASQEPISAFGPLADGVGGLGAMALAMIALLTGAFTLARERDRGSLSLLMLARSRGAVVAGKALGTCVYVLTAFVLMFAAAFGAAALCHDFTAVVEDGYEMASRQELWLETARAIGAGLPALLCCVCFGVLVSAMSAGVAAAAVGAVVPFTLLALFQSTLGRFADQLFVTYAPFFSQRAPLVRLTEVARAFSDKHWEAGELLHAALVPSIEGVAFVLLAGLVTRLRSA